MANSEVVQNVEQQVEKADSHSFGERFEAFKQSWIHHATIEIPAAARVGFGVGSCSLTPVGVGAGTGIGAAVGAVAATAHTAFDFFKEGGVNDQVTDGTWKTDKGVLYNGAAGATRVAGKFAGAATGELASGVGDAASGAFDSVGQMIDKATGGTFSKASNTIGDIWGTVKPFVPIMAIGGLMSMFGSGGNMLSSIGTVAGIGLACVLAKNTGILDTLKGAFGMGKDAQATADVDKAVNDSLDAKTTEVEQATAETSKKQIAAEQQKSEVDASLGMA